VEPRFYDPFSDDIVNVQNIVLLVLLGQSSGCLRCHQGLHGLVISPVGCHGRKFLFRVTECGQLATETRIQCRYLQCGLTTAALRWGCGRTPPTLYLDNPPPSCSEPEDRTHPFLLWSHRRERTNELPQNRSVRHFVLYSHTFLTNQTWGVGL
jgi:hypothetical protein